MSNRIRVVRSDHARRGWVENHDGLHFQFSRNPSGLGLSRWVRENRALIDRVIDLEQAKRNVKRSTV